MGVDSLVVLATAAPSSPHRRSFRRVQPHQGSDFVGYLPRFRVNITSERDTGQTHVPFVNWAPLCGHPVLVFMFKTRPIWLPPTALRVMLTMTIDTLLLFVVATMIWKWNRAFATPIVLGILPTT